MGPSERGAGAATAEEHIRGGGLERTEGLPLSSGGRPVGRVGSAKDPEGEAVPGPSPGFLAPLALQERRPSSASAQPFCHTSSHCLPSERVCPGVHSCSWKDIGHVTSRPILTTSSCLSVLCKDPLSREGHVRGSWVRTSTYVPLGGPRSTRNAGPAKALPSAQFSGWLFSDAVGARGCAGWPRRNFLSSWNTWWQGHGGSQDVVAGRQRP